MGMYLMRSIGREGLYQADLPDFMVFLDWKDCPGTGGDRPLPLGAAARRRRAGPARLRVRLLRVPLAHQGRVLLDHHAGAHLRGDAAVLPQRDRLRRQQRLHRLQAHPRLPDPTPRPARALRSPARCWSRRSSRPLPRDLQVGRVLRRSATPSRVMFCGYNPVHYKLASGRSRRCSAASRARSTCRRWASSIRARCRPANSIEIAIWVAVGGRGTLRRGPRRGPRQRREELLHPGVPRILAVRAGAAVHPGDAVPAERRGRARRPARGERRA